MEGRTEFYVNVDAVLAGAEEIGMTFTRAANMIENSMYTLVKTTILDVFNTAVQVADTQGGFPDEFKNHVMSAASRIIPTIFMDGRDLFISIDVEEQLGGRASLERAFHQGAALAEGSRIGEGGYLWGPYEGQELKNEDEDRHRFWEALEGGHDEFVGYTKEGRPYKMPMRKAFHTWEETKEQYINIWGEEAPEWLFIQWGQEEWQPYVTPFDIIGELQNEINYAAEALLLAEFEYSVAVANTFKTQGVEVGFTYAGQPRVVSGIAHNPSGRVSRAGQFTFKPR